MNDALFLPDDDVAACFLLFQTLQHRIRQLPNHEEYEFFKSDMEWRLVEAIDYLQRADEEAKRGPYDGMDEAEREIEMWAEYARQSADDDAPYREKV